MQHETHMVVQQGVGTKLVALIIVVALFAAAAAFVVYGSGIWNPTQQIESN